MNMAIPVHSEKPKILIPEKVSPDGLALLQASFDVHEKKGLSPEQLAEIIHEYEALIVRSETKVTSDLLNAAKKLISEHEGVWKWIYADGSIFEDAKAELFGKTATGKKRKRSDDEGSSKMFATDGKVKLVNDEFVIQSLILGALAEE